jgi:hypothetical protein
MTDPTALKSAPNETFVILDFASLRISRQIVAALTDEACRFCIERLRLFALRDLEPGIARNPHLHLSLGERCTCGACDRDYMDAVRDEIAEYDGGVEDLAKRRSGKRAWVRAR